MSCFYYIMVRINISNINLSTENYNTNKIQISEMINIVQVRNNKSKSLYEREDLKWII